MPPPLFAAVAEAQAPLRLQVKAPSGVVGILVELRASGDTSLGTASRPALSRPSIIGTGTDQTPLQRGRASASARCSWLASFSGAPSTPTLLSGAYNLPIHVHWMANSDEGVVFGGGGADGALLLYAVGGGGHTWSGELVWEEV